MVFNKSSLNLLILFSFFLHFQAKPPFKLPENPYLSKEDLKFTESQHQQLSRKFAAEGIVLAKNSGLPIKPKDKVVLFGQGSIDTQYGGFGSAEIYDSKYKKKIKNIKAVSVKEGIAIKAKEEKLIYHESKIGYDLENLEEEQVKDLAKKTEESLRTVAVLTISRESGETVDRTQSAGPIGTMLEAGEREAHLLLKKYFDLVVVVLNTPSVMELEKMPKDPKTSILICYFPGSQAGNAIADVLVGDVNPSGKLTDTWAERIDDYPSTHFFDTLEYVNYVEGLFVGYRYFEHEDQAIKKVVFPFGHGLSYTKFEITSKVEFNEGIFTVKSSVKNIGKVSGKEVVQVYVQKPENENFVKAKRELISFMKTKELLPDESQELTMQFNLNDLASYDDTNVTQHSSCYVLEEGDYDIYVANSVGETRENNNKIFTYHHKKFSVVQQLSRKLRPYAPEVLDSNKIPEFTDFMKRNNHRDPTPSPYKKLTNAAGKPHPKKLNIFKNKEVIVESKNVKKINFLTVLKGTHTMKQLVQSMSKQELIYLTYGHKAELGGGPGSIGGSYNIGKLSKYLIPLADTADGPAGIRHTEKEFQSTAWPCASLLACTFDPEIMRQVGIAAAKEARHLNVNIWLAPGMNLHRSPLGGRNFEYFSEDPLLSGKMAASLVKGAQSLRVAVTLKHFACNNKEKNRGDASNKDLYPSDSRMSERVLRELYLRNFEIAVKEGKPWCIMTSYNRVNGNPSSWADEMLLDILRKEWGYDGMIMTDWYNKNELLKEVKAGSNCKMPKASKKDIKAVEDALSKKEIKREDLEQSAIYVLETIRKTAAIDWLYKIKIVYDKNYKEEVKDNL